MLNKKLDEYLKEDFIPFHMPSHKRNTTILNKNLGYKRDITEIEGFDNLNDPRGILKDLETNIAKIYHAEDSIISVNGSTCGILSVIRALTRSNNNIIIQRNSHKSVYNAIELFNLKADYIMPKLNKDGIAYDIDYDDLSYKLDNNVYSLLVLESPNYEGYILDLPRIKEIVKDRALIVLDSAHGSHLILDYRYKDYKYYDIAVISFHKNLSALTPGAAILINKDRYSSIIRHNMSMLQTSSPSYLVIESIDEMISNFTKFYDMYKSLYHNLDDLYNFKLNNLRFINDKKKDYTKIVISTKDRNITGFKLKKLLYDRKIEIEMASYNYVILISSIFDTKKSFNMLKRALYDIDNFLEQDKLISVNDITKYKISQDTDSFHYKDKSILDIEDKFVSDTDISFDNKLNTPILSYNIPKKVYDISVSLTKRSKFIDYRKSEGMVSKRYIYLYPPGIPLLAPGELIDRDIIDTITIMLKEGAALSIKDKMIEVIY